MQHVSDATSIARRLFQANEFAFSPQT
jgi:hypothetical protein